MQDFFSSLDAATIILIVIAVIWIIEFLLEQSEKSGVSFNLDNTLKSVESKIKSIGKNTTSSQTAKKQITPTKEPGNLTKKIIKDNQSNKKQMPM